LASAVPVRKLRENGQVLLTGTRKGAVATENVKKILTQRGNVAAKLEFSLRLRCAAAPLREKSSLVTVI